jgi:hypothetical protein
MHIGRADRPTKVTLRANVVRAPRQGFRLRVESGSSPAIEAVFWDERVLVGRSPDADVVVDDDTASRIHCEITWEDDAFVLRDLGSRNGTWLNGMRVREIYLSRETQIGVGATTLSFSLVSAIGETRLHPHTRFGRLIGESEVMRAVFARLVQVAARDTTVLLEGESGTGKELAAEAIHEASSRSGGPFIVVDCGSIPLAARGRALRS